MQIIGHRGAKGLAPENTIAGIKFALRRRIDWIEFDVRSTSDGVVVVIHDFTLVRTGKRGKRVHDCTLEELQAIATRSGETIPTFAEVMAVIKDKAKINVELKDTASARAVTEEINRQVALGRPVEDFLVSSLFVKPLRRMKRLNAKIPRAYVHTLWPLTFLALPGLKLKAVAFFGMAAPKFVIRMAKRKGLWVYVYTINHAHLARRFEKRGVDAIMTDRPDAFLSLWPVVLRWVVGAVLLLLLGYVVRVGLG